MYELTSRERDRLLAFKHDLHQHPELSHQEYGTTRKIKAFLRSIPGVEIIDLPCTTGCAARLAGKRPGPEVGLRADIDAIEQTETFESPYRSRIQGVMHACGHDFHTAALLGAALILSGQSNRLSGTVDLIFQPA